MYEYDTTKTFRCLNLNKNKTRSTSEYVCLRFPQLAALPALLDKLVNAHLKTRCPLHKMHLVSGETAEPISDPANVGKVGNISYMEVQEAQHQEYNINLCCILEKRLVAIRIVKRRVYTRWKKYNPILNSLCQAVGNVSFTYILVKLNQISISPVNSFKRKKEKNGVNISHRPFFW